MIAQTGNRPLGSLMDETDAGRKEGAKALSGASGKAELDGPGGDSFLAPLVADFAGAGDRGEGGERKDREDPAVVSVSAGSAISGDG